MSEEENHIDTQSAALETRARRTVAAHIRPIATQQLDALLRIEELLAENIAYFRAQGATVTQVGPDEVHVELPRRKKSRS